MNVEKLEKAKLEYNVVCNHLQLLKSHWSSNDELKSPTLEQIICCQSLSRIEMICKAARRNYISALNKPMRADHPEKVELIHDASNIYLRAINRRKNLLMELENYREQKRRLEQRIVDLLKNS